LNVASLSARAPLKEVLASPKMLAILALAAASGFPNQITESALQAWLKDTGASNTTIGVMSYVALPYLLKFLWAPLIDRYPLPLLGRRRGWMFVMQLALAVTIALFALQDPRLALAPVAACALVIVFFSATQDIAFDAWRTDVSLPSERGLAAAATNLGYRTAAWVASACALIIADHFGWRPAFLLLAGVMVSFCVASVRAPEPAGVHQPRSLRESVVAPLAELLGTPSAVTLIAVVLLFKAGDAFANKLFTPFMMDVGFSKTEIALIVKALFTASTLVGSVIGGVLMVRLGLLRSMLTFGVLQALSNLLYCALALAGKSYPLMVTAVVIEHIAGAMGGIALVALIMALCDPRYSAFQYALLSALALLPRYSLGLPAGWVADHGGWYGYYVASVIIALPGLAIVWFKRASVHALDR
jgi:MFS transporter, PAT family, beta-lactamase induction signal transducer AmpG